VTPTASTAAAAATAGPDVPVGGLVLLALVAVLLAAVLAAADGALHRITRASAGELVATHRRGAGAVARLAENPDRAVNVVGAVRVLLEAVGVVCLTLVAATALGAWWQVLIGVLVVCAAVLLVVALAGPGRFGHRHPATVLLPLAPSLLALVALTGPLGRHRPRPRPDREDDEEAVEELRDMVDKVSESEQIEEDEREMLQSVFELGRTRTREVMVPRTSMVTLGADATAAKALRLFVRSGYSRVPVVGESVDDVVGLLYLKDVLRRVQAQSDAGGCRVPEIVRPAVFVPETKPVDDLMREMQQTSTHMAMVADEYGGVAGLVTIEDCLEEIVGELRDEHDRREPEVEHLDDGTVRVPARMAVDELGDLFGVELTDDEVHSAGGLLAKALGKVPIPGAVAEVQGLRLQAERAEGRRRQVSTLLVRRTEPTLEEAPEPTADRAPVGGDGPSRKGRQRAATAEARESSGSRS
jgi:CBS domain containing-hemolysin-like protein